MRHRQTSRRQATSGVTGRPDIAHLYRLPVGPDGSWQPLPSEDPDHLDARGAALRMQPIDPHAAMGREICPQEAVK
jgi:hypothetical protein